MGVRTQARVLLGLIFALMAATGFAVMAERIRAPHSGEIPLEEAYSPEAVRWRTQWNLGGLGLGASVVPAWSFNAFDPRQEPICESSDWPIPGGVCYSPDHVGPVSHFRPPRRGAGGIAGIPRLVVRAH